MRSDDVKPDKILQAFLRSPVAGISKRLRNEGKFYIRLQCCTSQKVTSFLFIATGNSTLGKWNSSDSLNVIWHHPFAWGQTFVLCAHFKHSLQRVCKSITRLLRKCLHFTNTRIPLKAAAFSVSSSDFYPFLHFSPYLLCPTFLLRRWSWQPDLYLGLMKYCSALLQLSLDAFYIVFLLLHVVAVWFLSFSESEDQLMVLCRWHTYLRGLEL